MAKISKENSTALKQQVISEDNIIDFVFHTLYNNPHIDEMHFQNEIIIPSGLQLDERQLEFIRELILNTNMVQSSIGFKKSGYIYLNAAGMQMMKNYKSYSAFAAAHKPPNLSPSPTTIEPTISEPKKSSRVVAIQREKTAKSTRVEKPSKLQPATKSLKTKKAKTLPTKAAAKRTASAAKANAKAEQKVTKAIVKKPLAKTAKKTVMAAAGKTPRAVASNTIVAKNASTKRGIKKTT
jgi:hypothetical protein